MNESVCPSCSQSDKTQKVSAIYKGGTHQWTETQHTTNADGSSGTSHIPRQAQTLLAKQLTPPEKPSAGSNFFLLWSGIGCFVVFILLVGFVLPIGLTLIATFVIPAGAYFLIGDTSIEAASPPILIGFGLLLCLSLIILITIGWFIWRWWKGKYDASVAQLKIRQAEADRNLPHWERAMSRWEKLYYCSRDDIVFIPNEKRAVPLAFLNDYLYNRY